MHLNERKKMQRAFKVDIKTLQVIIMEALKLHKEVHQHLIQIHLFIFFHSNAFTIACLYVSMVDINNEHF